MLRTKVVWKRSKDRALKSAVWDAVAAELRAIATDCRDDARQSAPGVLGDSIYVEENGELCVAVVTDAPQSPFLMAAVDRAKKTTSRRLAVAAQRAIEEAGRR